MTRKQDDSAKPATAPAFGCSSNGIAIPGRPPEADEGGEDKPLDLPISFTRLVPLKPRRTEG